MSTIRDWFGWVVEDRGRPGRRGRGVGGGKKKDFDGWNELAKKLDGKKGVRGFREGEVRWCSIGVNVGREMYGKKERFARPVLVLKRVSWDSFLGVPLTSTEKDLPGWLRYSGGGCFVLEQVRFYDARRVFEKVRTVDSGEFEKIKRAFLIYMESHGWVK